MDRPTCSTCPFWYEAQSQCRRHAPRPGEGSAWPGVGKLEFCGEHPMLILWIAKENTGAFSEMAQAAKDAFGRGTSEP
jgi:hypothetical protein